MPELRKGMQRRALQLHPTLTPQAQDFVVSGTASSKLFGMAEALWEPNLGPEDLFETISQALLNVSTSVCLTYEHTLITRMAGC